MISTTTAQLAAQVTKAWPRIDPLYQAVLICEWEDGEPGEFDRRPEHALTNATKHRRQ